MTQKVGDEKRDGHISITIIIGKLLHWLNVEKLRKLTKFK